MHALSMTEFQSSFWYCALCVHRSSAECGVGRSSLLVTYSTARVLAVQRDEWLTRGIPHHGQPDMSYIWWWRRRWWATMHDNTYYAHRCHACTCTCTHVLCVQPWRTCGSNGFTCNVERLSSHRMSFTAPQIPNYTWPPWGHCSDLDSHHGRIIKRSNST